MTTTEIIIRDGDVGSEIPLNLTHNGVAISEGSVDTATLLVRHSRDQVLALVLEAPGASSEFPDQWIYVMQTGDFTTLGVGQFYCEVHVVLNGGLGKRTFPTKGGLALHIIKRLVESA